MRVNHLKRREFITLLGGAAASWPLAVRAQQPAKPVIGLLNGVAFEAYADRITALRRGLKETGFVEGQNVAIEYRSADGQYDRLPTMAADLVRRDVAVIVCVGSTASPRAAKAATSKIPIVFAIGNDPVESGLVASLNRPEANVTGVSLNTTALAPKRLELLRELTPSTTVFGFLLNPTSPAYEIEARNLPAAAGSMGAQFVILKATTALEIDTAFTTMAQQKISALVISNDAFFNSRRDQILGLSARSALPVIYSTRAYVVGGGLISYGPNINDTYRHAGIYTGRILKGAKPADLPIQLPIKFELAINLKAAKALGLEVPLSLLIRADELLE